MLLEKVQKNSKIVVSGKNLNDERTDHNKGYSKRFYKELGEILEDNLEEISETEIVIDSEEDDDIKDNYNYQKNKVKREIRAQINKIKK